MTADRFMSKTVVMNNGCIEWTGSKLPSGYGRFRSGNKIELAHRYVAGQHGFNVTGKVVCHKCDNPGCVNIDHLFIGSQQDNVNDMMNKKRNRHNPDKGKLSEENVRDIRASTLTRIELAKKYNISPQYVISVKRGLYRKDVV